MSGYVSAEIRSQPDVWRRAAALAADVDGLPRRGERVAVVGCGTSWFVAMAYAGLRESAGFGLTDAFAASEFPAGREYDAILAVTRSGTTTEVVDLLQRVAERHGAGRPRTAVVVGVAGTPADLAADRTVLLDFADEQSVVQTRFATGTLALLRAHLGEDISAAARDAEGALAADLPAAALSAEQLTFLGRGWTVGLAHEAALKLREAAQSWTEAYPAMDYRHGPIAIAAPDRVVWPFGTMPAGLRNEVARTGAAWIDSSADPMAHLVLAQRVAVARADALGLDPDRPRALTRSVVLDAGV